MAEALIVVGAGGFAREALDVAEAMGQDDWDIVGVLDDAPSDRNLDRLRARGIAHLGAAMPQSLPCRDVSVAIAVGSPQTRSSIWHRFSGSSARMATLVHPRSDIGSQCRIGSGSVICAGVVVGTNVTLGTGVHLNPHATIGHDAVLHNFVSVNPAATVSGDCVIDEQVLLGAGSVVLQGLRVSASALVGAGAVVVRDVPVGRTVRGVPAV